MVTDEDLKKVINEVQKGSSRNYGKEMTAYNRHVIAVALVIERELGLQPAEAFALRADDLDVMRDKNGEITSSILHIKRTIHRDKGNRITLRFTKTDTRERPLPIRKELTETLIEMIKISEQRKPNPNNPPLYDDWNAYFMTKYDGKFFSVGKVGEYISGCAKRVGVSFDMYSSRHQVSNDLGPGSNTNQKTVMSIMGHSEYSTSLGYMEPTQEQLAAAMERVSKTDYTKMLNKNTQDTDAGGSQTTDSK